jgi:hypothetical protein
MKQRGLVHLARAAVLSVIGSGLVVAAPTHIGAMANAAEPLSFPTPLSPDLPFDINVDEFRKLDRDKQIPEAQRLFDIFAWQAFIALNWPAEADGTPDRNKDMRDNTSSRVWMSWRTNESVFKPDGSRPEPWDSANNIAAAKDHTLWRFSKMLNETRSPQNELTDFVQAFTGPLVDLNGKFVRYESYLNKTQFDYIVENELYNQEGQIEFVSNKGQPILFPANQVASEKKHGSMGIKLAWKQLGANDIPSRFFTREATVVSTSFDDKGNMVKTRSKQLMGLVGMHITALTQTSPNWIWTTFEQIDNVVANDLEYGNALNGQRLRVRPNFNNTENPTKPVNVLPPKNALADAKGNFTTWDEKKTTNPVQLTRLVPIASATQALNRQVQALLRQAGSVFQYYELVGAQWPVQPRFPAFPGGVLPGGAGSAPESILFKAPGRVVPVYNVNSTLESYFQGGNQVAGPLEEDDRLPAGFFADRPTEPVTPDRTIVFGTESCVGCHYSAGAVVAFKRDENGNPVRDPATGLKIPVYGERANFGQTGNADYYWQFQFKARQTAPSPTPAKR